MKRYLPLYTTGLAFFIGYFFVNAQNHTNITQWMFARSNFNPAATGINKGMEFMLWDREQWIGLEGRPSYRFQDAVSLVAGAEVVKGLRIGYSYDYSLGGLRPYNTGSHEVMLMFSARKVRKPKPYYNNPRNF